MHYAFDRWMDREFPSCPFERYADDVVAHCNTEGQARALLASVADRFAAVGLELHPEKTKIAYCKDAIRRGNSEHTSFDFLGYTFRARVVRGPRGFFVSFNPAMSAKARKAKGKQIRALAPQASQQDGSVRSRRGHQSSGAGLDQLLRALLPLGVVLPRKAHRRAPRSMGCRGLLVGACEWQSLEVRDCLPETPSYMSVPDGIFQACEP